MLVIPAECQYAYLKTKLEIKLVKAMNIHWMQLGCNRKYGTDWDKLEAIVKEEVGVFWSWYFVAKMSYVQNNMHIL